MLDFIYILMDECMNSKPIYLNLFAFKFPITAIASIAHRLSGIALFFFIPVFLFLLDVLINQRGDFPDLRWLMTLIAIFVTYHFLAGCRHLIMDAGFGESKRAATISSWLVFGLTVILSIIIGYAIWK